MARSLTASMEFVKCLGHPEEFYNLLRFQMGGRYKVIPKMDQVSQASLPGRRLCARERSGRPSSPVWWCGGPKIGSKGRDKRVPHASHSLLPSRSRPAPGQSAPRARLGSFSLTQRRAQLSWSPREAPLLPQVVLRLKMFLLSRH